MVGEEAPPEGVAKRGGVKLGTLKTKLNSDPWL